MLFHGRCHRYIGGAEPPIESALGTLKAFPPVPPGKTEASSRWLYDMGPQEEIEDLKQEVSAAVSMRLAALAKALKHLPPRRNTPVACR